MGSDTRPIVVIKKSKLDYFFQYSSFSIVLFMWSYTSYHFNALPAIIPIHFDIAGAPDGYGSRNTLWILPAIVTGIVFLFNALAKYPHKFNYIIKITEENAVKQYKSSVRLLRILSFNISILFCYIIVSVIEGSISNHSLLGWWFIPLLFISMILPTIYMTVTSSRNNK